MSLAFSLLIEIWFNVKELPEPNKFLFKDYSCVDCFGSLGVSHYRVEI